MKCLVGLMSNPRFSKLYAIDPFQIVGNRCSIEEHSTRSAPAPSRRTLRP